MDYNSDLQFLHNRKPSRFSHHSSQRFPRPSINQTNLNPDN